MLNWGLIGAGAIARVFCNGLRFSKTGRAVAVASQTPGKAAGLAAAFGIPRRYDTYDALLADPAVDAVYISTIHPLHLPCALAAAAAGKHILVEKPIAMNRREAAAMIDAARAHDVFLMEAFMYRCHPQTRRLAQLLSDGALGQVRIIRAVFSYAAPFDPASRAYAYEMGGGGILDIGCYPASMSRLLAGAALGQPFAEPISLKASGVIGPTGVDHYTAATLEFPGGILAQLIAGVACRMPVEVSVYGDKGALSVPNPWLPSSPVRNALVPLPLDTSFPSEDILLTSYADAQAGPQAVPTAITTTADRDLYTYEADMVAEHIARRQAPVMSWDDSLGNMHLLDRWRAEIGLTYPQDSAG